MKVLKVLLVLFGIVVIMVAAAAAYVKIALPDTGKAPVITVWIATVRQIKAV